MVNFKFFKVQIKNTIWITAIFAIIFAIISILSMSFTKYFWDTNTKIDGVITGYSGGLSLLHMVRFFGPLGEALAVVFAIALTMKLISSEINRNYISSWLSLPMSRKTIFLTKLLTIVIASFLIVLFNLIIQLLIIAIKVAVKQYSDFASAEAAILIKLNFGLLLLFLFISSMIFLIANFFNKISHVLTLSALIPAFFIVLFLFSDLSNTFGVKFFHYLKYITFFSLFDYQQLIKNANLQFIWKFILLIILASACFYGSFSLFKRKNFHV